MGSRLTASHRRLPDAANSACSDAVSVRTLPQGLSALAEGLGNLLPRQPSRARNQIASF